MDDIVCGLAPTLTELAPWEIADGGHRKASRWTTGR
jgi:hypothetical protein